MSLVEETRAGANPDAVNRGQAKSDHLLYWVQTEGRLAVCIGAREFGPAHGTSLCSQAPS